MFDPYHKWLGIPKEKQPPTYFQLLGIQPEERDPEVIDEAAIRQMKHLRDYQIGPQAAECTRLLNEVALARATLLNPAKRRDYEAKLAQQAVLTANAAKQRVTGKPPEAPRGAVQATSPSPKAAREPAPSPRPAAKDRDIRKPTPLGLYLGLGGGGFAVVAAILIAVLMMRAPNENKAAVNNALPNPGKQPGPAPDKAVVALPAEKPPAPIKPFEPAPAVAPIVIAKGGPMDPLDAEPRGPGVFASGIDEAQFLHILPGGRFCLFRGRHRSHQGEGHYVWDMQDKKPVHYMPLGQPGAQRCLALLPDGKRALAGEDRTLIMLDLAQGKQDKIVPLEGNARSIVVSPKGNQYLVVVERDQPAPQITLWDVDQEKPKAAFDAPAQVQAASFTQNEGVVLIKTPQQFVNIDAKTGKPTTAFELGPKGGYAHHLAPAGNHYRCFLGSDWVWLDLVQRREVAHDKNMRFPRTASSDGRWLLSGNSGQLTLWDWSKQAQVRTWQASPQDIRETAVCDDGQIVVTYCSDKTLRVWRLQEPAPAFAGMPADWGEVKTIATDAGAVVVVLDSQRVVIHRSFSWLMDVDTFEKKKDFGHIGGDCAPRSHHGGKVLYYRDRGSQSLDLATGQKAPLTITHPQRLLGLEYSPGGKYIAAHEDNGWKLYDGQKHQQLGHMAGLTGEIHAVAFFKDESRCLVGERHFLHVVELPSLAKIKSWRVTNDHVDGIVLAPDETTAAFVAGRQLHLFDLAQGAVTRQFTARSTRYAACAFFPNHPWLAFGLDEDIVLWNWRTMTLVARHNFDAEEVRQIAITPDGRNLLVHRGGQVQRWKLGPELLK